MNGKIHSSVGFTKTDGVIRTLTIGEQLKQIVMSRTDGSINHPTFGRLNVRLDVAKKLQTHPEEWLERFNFMTV